MGTEGRMEGFQASGTFKIDLPAAVGFREDTLLDFTCAQSASDVFGMKFVVEFHGGLVNGEITVCTDGSVDQKAYIDSIWMIVHFSLLESIITGENRKMKRILPLSKAHKSMHEPGRVSYN